MIETIDYYEQLDTTSTQQVLARLFYFFEISDNISNFISQSLAGNDKKIIQIIKYSIIKRTFDNSYLIPYNCSSIANTAFVSPSAQYDSTERYELLEKLFQYCDKSITDELCTKLLEKAEELEDTEAIELIKAKIAERKQKKAAYLAAKTNTNLLGSILLSSSVGFLEHHSSGSLFSDINLSPFLASSFMTFISPRTSPFYHETLPGGNMLKILPLFGGTIAGLSVVNTLSNIFGDSIIPSIASTIVAATTAYLLDTPFRKSWGSFWSGSHGNSTDKGLRQTMGAPTLEEWSK